MKKVLVLVSLVALVFGSMAACSAATSIYGIGGLIETPDDSIAGIASPQFGGVFMNDLAGSGYNGSSFGGVIGVMPKLEVGAAALSSDVPGADTQSLVNAKYRFMAETIASPSITVGVVDLTSNLDEFNGKIDGSSAFVVLGKNLTSVAEGVAGSVVKPIRGTLGFGTGLYKGGFAGLTISAAPKFDVVVEYLTHGLRQEATFNGAVRFTPSQSLTITAGALDFSEFYAGLNYSAIKY